VSYSLVAHTISGTNSGGTTSPGINTTGASLLVVCVVSYVGAAAPTLSDSNGNTWTGLTTYTGLTSSRVRVYYAASPTVGAGHTFTVSGTSSFAAVAVLALSGSAASPFDQENGAAAVQPGSVTPSEDNEILLAFISDDIAASTSTSVDSGFTFLDSQANSNGNYFGLASAYLIETTATAKNPTFSGGSGSGSQTAAIATFKAAAGGGGGGAVGADAMHYVRQHIMGAA
jgi:hypothetical protein